MKHSILSIVILQGLLSHVADGDVKQEHSVHSAIQRPHQPNIIVLLTDDLGWQDVDCYDIDEKNAYQTPRIDELATKGAKFLRAYSPAPTCAPSRCAIVSGVHPARAQKTHIKGGKPPHPAAKTSRMMSPWFSARTPVGDYTIASALKDAGYTTGHVGKWHISYSEPKATDLGFDVSYGGRISKAKMDDRLVDFATQNGDDPYKLDENGFSYNQTTENALEFLNDSSAKAKPFFLYYATWLVHAPIQTRSKELLDKYSEQMGIDPADKKSFSYAVKGQKNPFYAAMVEELDYNVGRVFDYLESTDDPRWPGHKLVENTYVIFTSDNGGTEGKSYERYTDNTPLSLGKTYLKEGGVRVPFIVTGPGVTRGVESNVLINGLDIYPTALAMAGVKKVRKSLDGLSLYPLLTGEVSDANLVKNRQGEVRDGMMWHFPHNAMESSLIVGDFKLIKNYDFIGNLEKQEFELYQLYDSSRGELKRVDIEERKNLAGTNPDLLNKMKARLESELAEMNASVPHYNPHFNLVAKNKVPKVINHTLNGNVLTVAFKQKASQVREVSVIYSTQSKKIGYQEWFSKEMKLEADSASVDLPKGTKFCYINLIDENNYLISYPQIKKAKKEGKLSYSDGAIAVDAS